MSHSVQPNSRVACSMSVVLLKLPLLLSAVYFSILCGRSPQPAPKKCEESKFAGLESSRVRSIIKWLPSLLVVPSMWLTSIFECTAILLRFGPVYEPLHLLVSRFGFLQTDIEVCITPAFIAGWLLLAGGTLIRIVCYHHLGQHFTFELALRDNHKLVTTGPYSIVRHPAYTGSIMALIGIGLIQFSRGSWWAEVLGLWTSTSGSLVAFIWTCILTTIPVAVIARTYAEDKVLRRAFGKEWLNWAQETRFRLLPGVY